MAISQDKWDKAKTLFESGKLSLSEISKQTGIDKSSISKKAKIQQWSSVENSDYIDAKVLIATKKSTLPMEKINTLDDVANDIIRRKNLIFNITEKILHKIDKSVSLTAPILDEEGKEIGQEDLLIDSKSAKEYIEAIDKASITLGVNQRHANSQVNISNTNATQTNIELNKDIVLQTLKSFDDEY